MEEAGGKSQGSGGIFLHRKSLCAANGAIKCSPKGYVATSAFVPKSCLQTWQVDASGVFSKEFEVKIAFRFCPKYKR